MRDLHPGHDPCGLDLLARHPKPTETEIREGLAGNLCRCTGYTKIFESKACRELERGS